MHEAWGWRTAFVIAGLVGIVVAGIVALIPDTQPIHTPAKRTPMQQAPKWHVLLSAPILRNLLFFTLLAVITAGIYNYSVVALAGAYDTSLGIANAGLTGFLLTSSAGVLAGGVLVGRTSRHALVAGAGLAATAAFIALVASADLGTIGLVGALSLAGFFSGVIMPSRDMIVREITPPGSFGKVFGFVTTGFSLGGIVAPLLFGAIMDHASPRLVFVSISALCVMSIVTVVSRPQRP